MGFNISIVLERDGKKVVLATVENIDAVEQIANDTQATFRFHVEGATNPTMGGGAQLMILDKLPAIKKIFTVSPPAAVQTASPNPPTLVVAPVTLPTKEADESRPAPDNAKQ
jgi:molybdopterin/thiamine biosynthesis adenylyltransferase